MADLSAPAFNPARWHFLCVSDLSAGRNVPGVHLVDKYSFDELFSAVTPRLSISAPNRLGAGPTHLDLDLTFTSLKDFSPDAVVQKIPVLEGLVRIRTAIARFTKTELSAEAMRRAIADENLPEAIRDAVEALLTTPKPAQPPHPAAAKTGTRTDDEKDSSLHNIYAMVDLGDSTDSRTSADADRSPLNALTDAIADAEGGGPALRTIDEAVRAIDGMLAAQIDAVIHHETFRECEARWRELRTLVDSIDFRAGMHLSVIACDKESVRRRLIDDVFKEVWNTRQIAPDLVAISHPYGRTPRDYEALADIAKIGQSAQTTMICWAGPSFFGVESFSGLFETIGSARILMDGHGYESWRSFRDTDEAGWLALSTGAVCARSGYGSRETAVKSFQYEEPSDDRDRPWMSASVILAASLARAFGELAHGNRDAVANAPMLDQMPVAPLKGGKAAAACPDVWSRDQCGELSDAGLLPLACAPNDVAAGAASTNTVSSSGRSICQAALAGRCGRIALEAAARMSGQPPEGISAAIAATIQALFLPDNRYAQGVAAVKVEKREENAVYSVTVDSPYPVFGDQFSAEVSFQA